MRKKIKPFVKIAGLTLMEMIIVMAILSMGTASAILGMNSLLPNLQLKAAVRHLKSDLHLARFAAIRQNAFVVTEFNMDNNTYTIYIDDGGGDSAKAHNYSRDKGEEIFKTVRFHPRVHLFKAKFGSVAGKFAFNSRGTMDGLAGGVYLRSVDRQYRGVAISRIGKMTIKSGSDGRTWHRLN